MYPLVPPASMYPLVPPKRLPKVGGTSPPPRPIGSAAPASAQLQNIVKLYVIFDLLTPVSICVSYCLSVAVLCCEQLNLSNLSV